MKFDEKVLPGFKDQYFGGDAAPEKYSDRWDGGVNIVACAVVGCALGMMGALCEMVFATEIYSVFMAAASEVIDGQSFFMFGTIVAGIVCAAIPVYVRKRAGAISIVGALCFSFFLASGYAIQTSPDFCKSVAPLLLVLWSISFNCVKLPILCMLIDARNFPLLVLCMALSRSVLIVASFGIILASPFLQCLFMFTGAFFCVVLTVWSVRICKSLDCCSAMLGMEDCSRPSLVQMVGRTAFVCISAATLRIVSPLGACGGFDVRGISFVGSLFAAFGVLLLAKLMFLRKKGGAIGQGWGAAPIVIVGGLFLATLGFNEVNDFVTRLTAVLVLLLYNFAHVAYWNEVASLGWRLPGPSMRIIGEAMALYAVCEFLWRSAFQNIGGSTLFLIIAVAYVLMIAVWHLFPNTKLVPVEKSNEMEALRSQASRYALSPRETEIFLLLARGYSRRKIQEKLGLSDGTVKTYASRVYKKLGVVGKQEMLTMLFGDSDGGGEDD